MTLSRRGLLALSVAGLAGCNVLPEEDNEPIEASASTPALLAEGTGGYAETVATTQTIEVTVDVDLSGDIEISTEQDVIATVFRRAYERDGQRFGLVTAPAVAVIDQPEVIRDPLTALPTARVVELATDLSVSETGTSSEDGSVTMLDEEEPLRRTTATTDGGEVQVAWTRVRAGDDSVTAMATGEGDGPFDAVTREEMTG